MKATCAALVAILCIAAAATAAEKPETPDGFKVESVAVFKNGYGFFRAGMEARVKGGEVTFTDIPAAALGRGGSRRAPKA